MSTTDGPNPDDRRSRRPTDKAAAERAIAAIRAQFSAHVAHPGLRGADADRAAPTRDTNPANTTEEA